MSKSEPLHKHIFPAPIPTMPLSWGGGAPSRPLAPEGRAVQASTMSGASRGPGGDLPEARPGGGRRRLDGVPPRGKLFGGMGAGEGRCVWAR